MAARSKKLALLAIAGTLAISCSTPASPHTPSPSVLPTHSPSLLLTDTVEVGTDQVPTNTVVPTPPSIPFCDRGAFIFTARQSGPTIVPQGSIYWACSNGIALRRIISDESLGFGSLAVSRDNVVAVSALHEASSTLLSTLFKLDLTSFSLSEVATRAQGEFRPRWSPDGQYLAYQIHSPTPSETFPETHVEIRHLASGVTSEIRLSGISHFDWAPDGVKAVFQGWVQPEKDIYGFQIYRIYVGDITCGDQSHICQLSDIREIRNVERDPSWLPDAETLVSTTYGSDTNKLLITDLQGSIVQEIDLDRMAPLASSATQPKMSGDGAYLAFISNEKSLYIYDMAAATLSKVVFKGDIELDITAFDWLN